MTDAAQAGDCTGDTAGSRSWPGSEGGMLCAPTTGLALGAGDERVQTASALRRGGMTRVGASC